MARRHMKYCRRRNELLKYSLLFCLNSFWHLPSNPILGGLCNLFTYFLMNEHVQSFVINTVAVEPYALDLECWWVRFCFRLWWLLLNCPPHGVLFIIPRTKVSCRSLIPQLRPDAAAYINKYFVKIRKIKWAAGKLCHLLLGYVNDKILSEFESRWVSLQTSILSISLGHQCLKRFPLWLPKFIFYSLTPEQPARKKNLTMKDTCLEDRKEVGWGWRWEGWSSSLGLAWGGGQGTSQDKSQGGSVSTMKKPESLRCEKGSPA